MTGLANVGNIRGEHMLVRWMPTAAVLLILAAPASAKCIGEGPHDTASLRTICDLERAWGQSLVSGDANVPRQILADDFLGVDTKGKLYRKADEVRDVGTASSRFATDTMDDVVVRFYGNTAVAQGSDSWTGKSGKAGRFVWTDVWLVRDRRWQQVASEDLVAP